MRLKIIYQPFCTRLIHLTLTITINSQKNWSHLSSNILALQAVLQALFGTRTLVSNQTLGYFWTWMKKASFAGRNSAVDPEACLV
jgi:hypothetical protein